MKILIIGFPGGTDLKGFEEGTKNITVSTTPEGSDQPIVLTGGTVEIAGGKKDPKINVTIE